MTDENTVETPLADAPLPVEQVADSSTAEAETPVEQADDTSRPRDEDGKFLSANAQKRIDKLTWEKNREREEAQYWREQAKKAQQPQEVPKAPEATKPLKLEDFQYDEAAYYAAVNDQARAIARQEALAALKEEREAEQQRARAQTFQTRAQEFAKSKPDFTEIATDRTLPVNATMAEVIRDSEIGPELLYWIGQNREQAAAIYDLPPHMSARELGRIEARLEAQKEAVKRPTVPPISKAPPPPPVVDSSESSPGDIKASSAESDKLSDAEWARRREKELRRKKA
jgi:hypothetical protein